MADSMPVSSDFALGDESSPMFAGTDDSALSWAAGRIGMARRIDFTVPAVVTAGPDPRAEKLDRWLRRFGGHEAILMDLESRRGPPEHENVVVFDDPLQVGSLPPEQALALAIATGDKPPPAVMDRAFIDATAQLADINRLAGDYTVGAVAASAPGAYRADWYRLAGLGALLFHTGGSDNAAAELFAKADAISEETFRNTGVEPEHQQVVAAWVDAALGLMGATKGAIDSSLSAVRTSSGRNALSICASRSGGGGAPGGQLNGRQRKLLTALKSPNTSTLVHRRAVRLGDLAALTRHTGNEFGMMTLAGRRRVFRGSRRNLGISEDQIYEMALGRWRFSGHTHPGTSFRVLSPSGGDREVLKLFREMGTQQKSVILNSGGELSTFTSSFWDDMFPW